LRAQFLHFFDELLDVFAFAVAHVDEADAYCVAVVDDLHYAAEAERDAVNAEFGFDAGVDADREAMVATDAAATEAQVDDAAGEAGGDFEEDDVGRVVNRVPGMAAALGRRICID